MASIELDRVSLTFHVRQQGRITLKEFVVRRLFRRSYKPPMKVHALRDVTLRVHEGERLAILGHNGAGKSTLLKLLAGIYPPTKGHCRVQGQISSLFDIALGFEPEATGWENIAYRGYLQGETPKSIRAKVEPIAVFSELGDFLNMPVRYYSAGMMVRLAFSIATAIDPEILLVDEVLSVGDMAFQHKAQQRMREMMAKARLIVMVSHDLAALAKICDRAVWMDHGRVRQIGPIAEVAETYQESVIGALHQKEKLDASANGHEHDNDRVNPNGQVNGNATNGTGNAIAKPGLRGPDLRAFERRVFSQDAADGMIEEAFRRLGAPSKFFVELSSEAANGSNGARLALEEDWRGVFVNPGCVPNVRMMRNLCFPNRVRCLDCRVTSTTIEEVLAANDVPLEFDLLSIVLAGNDYWVWSAIKRWRPRVVVIQYNASHGPTKRWVMKEDADYRWNGTSYYGASLASLTALGREKGYALVATDSTGDLAFLVREELLADDPFLDPVVQFHYMPPRYGPQSAGYSTGDGPFVEV
jgi:ABC-type polysaccharide/polyol phosphate transport system ATPase subunit